MTEDIKELQTLVISLLNKVDELSGRLAKYETPKNCNNSSISPSKDENRPKRRSLREPSGQN